MNRNHRAARVSIITLAALWCTAAWPDEAQQKPFPPELLGNSEYIEIGKGVFEQICKFCHGKTAYPGKAPKLNPSRYTPEFVFDRVTNGFRGMPSWKEQYSDKERQGVTVYIMSKEFSN